MRRLFAPILIAALAAGLWLGPASASAAEPLVGVAWLKEHLRDKNLVVLDVRSAIDGGGQAAYEEAHIPGAVHTDYDKSGWRVTRGDVPFMLPTTAELEKLIGDLGIDETSRVVVVPAGTDYHDFGAAARTYWTLKVAGVTDVSILDGGVAAWKAAGLPVESGVSKPSPTIFTATINEAMITRVGDVSKAQDAKNATLIDARPPQFYSGKEKAPFAKAYGHIPGAISVDSATFFDEANHRLKPRTELQALANKLPKGPVITYCNTGHWAATDWFVLHELLGRTDVSMYYGSMVEWASDPSRPVESSRTKWDDLKKALGLGL